MPGRNRTTMVPSLPRVRRTASTRTSRVQRPLAVAVNSRSPRLSRRQAISPETCSPVPKETSSGAIHSRTLALTDENSPRLPPLPGSVVKNIENLRAPRCHWQNPPPLPSNPRHRSFLAFVGTPPENLSQIGSARGGPRPRTLPRLEAPTINTSNLCCDNKKRHISIMA